VPGVVVVTDSTSSLDRVSATRAGVRVIPLQVVVAGCSRAEDEVEPREIARALREERVVSTSRPAPEAFAALYARLAAEGCAGVVSAHLSGRISGTVEAAKRAAAAAPLPVRVLDTGVIGMASGFAALAGAAEAEFGAEIDEVAATITQRAAAATTYFYVADLAHLRRGGRIGAASAAIGSALAVKPLLTVVAGEIRSQERVRTASRALGRLRELAQAAARQARTSGYEVEVAVHHLDDRAAADQLVESLGEGAGGLRRIQVVELSAVLGVHTGPGTLGVVVSPVV